MMLIRNKTSVPTLFTPIQHNDGNLASAIRQGKEIKAIRNEKGEVKLSLF